MRKTELTLCLVAALLVASDHERPLHAQDKDTGPTWQQIEKDLDAIKSECQTCDGTGKVDDVRSITVPAAGRTVPPPSKPKKVTCGTCQGTKRAVAGGQPTLAAYGLLRSGSRAIEKAPKKRRDALNAEMATARTSLMGGLGFQRDAYVPEYRQTVKGGNNWATTEARRLAIVDRSPAGKYIAVEGEIGPEEVLEGRQLRRLTVGTYEGPIVMCVISDRRVEGQTASVKLFGRILIEVDAAGAGERGYKILMIEPIERL